MSRDVDARVLVPLLLAAVAVLALWAGATWYGVLGEDDDRATVTVLDENGTVLARLDVRVADTYRERYRGLSETASLGEDEGMLFVHDAAGRHTYVMRNMSFPIDIVFVATNGTVTRIHHAEVPPPGTTDADLTPYRGRGKYVLELSFRYTTRHGIAVGDRVRIEGLGEDR